MQAPKTLILTFLLKGFIEVITAEEWAYAFMISSIFEPEVPRQVMVEDVWVQVHCRNCLPISLGVYTGTPNLWLHHLITFKRSFYEGVLKQKNVFYPWRF